MHQRHDWECRPGFNPRTGENFSNGKKWWGLMFQILQLPISNFQVSFRTSLSLRKNSTGSPAESQSRSIREQKSLRVNLEKTQCSRKREVHSSTQRVNLDKKLSAVAVGERWEEEKKVEWKRWRHHLNHQSYVCEKSNKNHLNNYCKKY